jgi:hypothetical protein
LIIISGLPAVFRTFLPPTTFDILAIHPIFGGFDVPIYFYLFATILIIFFALRNKVIPLVFSLGMIFSVLSFSLFLFYVTVFGENYYFLGKCENKNIYAIYDRFNQELDIIQQESGNLVNLGSFYISRYSGNPVYYYNNTEKVLPQIANCPDILNKTQELWEKLK